MSYETIFNNLKIKLGLGTVLDSVESDYVDICNSVTSKNIDLALFFAESSILANSQNESRNKTKRDSLNFVIPTNRNKETLTYAKDAGFHIDIDKARTCIIQSNLALERIHDLSLIYGVQIFELLGLRNLSAFVGQVLVKSFHRNHKDILMENPNQDGYPDLCALTKEGLRYIQSDASCSSGIKSNKELWSPYPYGGIEVKATCGN